MIKRIISVLITFLLILPLMTSFVIADTRTVSVIFNGINAARGADQIIVYTNGSVTGTNEWGYEVTVGADGRITKVGGNNSVIPAGGFVVSGHGTGAEYLRNNAFAGDYVKYFIDIMSLTISNEYISDAFELNLNITGVNIYRGEDYLVIYNNERGSTTRANEWGYEVTVDKNGIVTKVGGFDSPIPTGGFVVSGHGVNAQKLQTSVSVGMDASYDVSKMTVTFVYSINAQIYADEQLLNTVSNQYDAAISNFAVIDKDVAKEALDEATTAFQNAKSAYRETSDKETYSRFSDGFPSMIKDVGAAVSEQPPVEYRGVWLRPSEKTESAVAQTVESLYNAGINQIIIESQFSGYMIMPQPNNSGFEQNPFFNGFDVLQSYIDECHKRGMELHIWMTVFQIGYSSEANNSRMLFAKHPDWCMLSNNGSIFPEGGGMVFLDPANDTVQSFLLDTYRYILEKYDIDAFQLDYIRYPGYGVEDWGYNKVNVDEFKKEYGYSGNIKFDQSASYWNDWREFRAGKVTELVRQVRALIDEVSPKVLLSAAVFPGISSAHSYVFQDYRLWAEEGLLDLLNPMTYGTTAVDSYVPSTVEAIDDCMISPGLGVFEGDMFDFNVFEQVIACRNYGAYGTVCFESTSYLRKECGELLNNTLYSQKALTPKLNPQKALDAYKTFACKRVNEVILPMKNITSQQANSICDAINSITDKQTLNTAYTVVNNNASDTAGTAIKRDLQFLGFVLGMNKSSNSEPVKTVYSQTDVSSLLSQFSQYDYKCVLSKNGKPSNNDSLVCSGDILRYGNSKDDCKSVIITITGDINGDGKVSALDYLMQKRACLGTYIVFGAKHKAACITDGKAILTVDYLKLKRYVLGTYQL